MIWSIKFFFVFWMFATQKLENLSWKCSRTMYNDIIIFCGPLNCPHSIWEALLCPVSGCIPSRCSGGRNPWRVSLLAAPDTKHSGSASDLYPLFTARHISAVLQVHDSVTARTAHEPAAPVPRHRHHSHIQRHAWDPRCKVSLSLQTRKKLKLFIIVFWDKFWFLHCAIFKKHLKEDISH